MDAGDTNRLRWVVWLGVVTTALGLCLLYGTLVSDFEAVPLLRIALWLGLGVAMFALVFAMPRIDGLKGTALAILLPAAILRLALLPAAPSDDVYRYAWEGRLVAQSESPYAFPAEAQERIAFQDTNWERMNNRDKLTAYPPGAILTFATISSIHYSVTSFKIAFTLFDLLVVGLVLGLLALQALPLRWAGFYAFNPVVLISFAAEAHFDVLLVLSLVATAFFAARKQPGLAAACLAAGVQMKFVAVLGLPFLLWKAPPRAWVAAGLILILPCFPFLETLPGLMAGLFDFGANRSFNGPVHHFLTWGGVPGRLASLICIGLLASLVLTRLLGPNGGRAWTSDWMWSVGALICLTPTFHFWYLTWILPFVCLRPSPAWLVFSVSSGFYLFVWHNQATGGNWGLLWWQSLLIWAPFTCLALYESRFLWHRFREHWLSAQSSSPGNIDNSQADGLTVVIPTLNAAGILPDCVKSLSEQTVTADEIIVADGGSIDNSVKTAGVLGVQVVSAQAGRGNQLAAGISCASYPKVLLLHADCQLPREAIARIHQFFATNPSCAGGCLGQRFDRGDPVLLIVEILNEARASLKGSSFGDQAQFFDRRRIPSRSFPAQPLMEDVEFSLRMLERGCALYVGAEVRSAAGKWHGTRRRRFFQVISLVARYRWHRMRKPSQLTEISQDLYREYYRCGGHGTGNKAIRQRKCGHSQGRGR